MKRFAAFIAAVIVTGLVGLGMLAIGVNATLSPVTPPASNVSAAPASNADASTQAQIARLQNLVAQYQGREKQYQAALNQANAQVQQYESVLAQLQQLGIIRINSDGSIQLGRRGLGRGDDGG